MVSAGRGPGASSLCEEAPRLADRCRLLAGDRYLLHRELLETPLVTWLQARRHPGRVWFEVDVPAGEPSKWLTLCGTRVLEWWDAAQRATSHTP